MQCRNVGGRSNGSRFVDQFAQRLHRPMPRVRMTAVMPLLVAARCTPDLFCAAEHLSTVATTNPRSPRTCDGFLRARKRGCARVANPKREPSDASRIRRSQSWGAPHHANKHVAEAHSHISAGRLNYRCSMIASSTLERAALNRESLKCIREPVICHGFNPAVASHWANSNAP